MVGTYENIPLNWEEILSVIVPQILTKVPSLCKSIHSKKLYDKLKDIKLAEVGLLEKNVEDYLTSHHNVSVKEPSIIHEESALRTSNFSASAESLLQHVPKGAALIMEQKDTSKEKRSSLPPGFVVSLHDKPEKSRLQFQTITELSNEDLTELTYHDPSETTEHTSLSKSGTLETNEDGPLLDPNGVLELTPMFMQKLKSSENDTIEFAAQLKKLTTICRECYTSGESYSKGLTKLSSILTLFVSKMNEHKSEAKTIEGSVKLEKGFMQFSHLIQDTERLREKLLNEMQHHLISTMEEIVDGDIKEIRKQMKKFEKHSSQYERVEKANSNRKDSKKSQIELVTKKSKMQVSGLTLALMLNSIHHKKKFQFIESMSAFLLDNLDYFEQGYALFKQMEPAVRHLMERAGLKRKVYEKYQQEMKQQRQIVERILFTNPTHKDSDSKQGYLFKKTGNVKSIWKKRFFVVDEGMMLEKKDLETVNGFPLLTCTVKPRPDLDRRYFEVSTPHKTYLLQAENADECNEWVTFLQNTISKELNSQPVQVSENTDEQQESTELTVLQNSNPFCCDCNAENPDWASINLVCVICIECSGIHRSLGRDISKVRSLTLDKWEEELLQLFLAIKGNTTVNTILEHSVPEDWIKSTPKSDRSSREKWIRAKYEQKMFTAPLPKNPTKILFSAIKKNNVVTVLELICQGCNLDSINRHGRAALHVSILKGHILCVLLLLLNRANVSVTDSKGWNVLHYAAANGHCEITHLLLKNTPKELIESEDNAGNTPLDLALQYKNGEVAKILLDSQALIQDQKET